MVIRPMKVVQERILLEIPQIVRSLNRLLEPHGLIVKTEPYDGNGEGYVFIRIEKLPKKPEVKASGSESRKTRIRKPRIGRKIYFPTVRIPPSPHSWKSPYKYDGAVFPGGLGTITEVSSRCIKGNKIWLVKVVLEQNKDISHSWDYEFLLKQQTKLKEEFGGKRVPDRKRTRTRVSA